MAPAGEPVKTGATQTGRRRIGVVDYGLGNLSSVSNALSFLGYEHTISRNAGELARCDSYVLPGVGAFAEGMSNLRRMGLEDLLNAQVRDGGKPALGICLGMQLLAGSSTEKGLHHGLGWIEGQVVRLDYVPGAKVPHVGWNEVRVVRKDPLFVRTEPGHCFYFDHSYHMVCEGDAVAAMVTHGSELVAAVRRGNIFGVQFHPEKSQTSGLKLLRSFFESIGHVPTAGPATRR